MVITEFKTDSFLRLFRKSENKAPYSSQRRSFTETSEYNKAVFAACYFGYIIEGVILAFITFEFFEYIG